MLKINHVMGSAVALVIRVKVCHCPDSLLGLVQSGGLPFTSRASLSLTLYGDLPSMPST